MADGRGRYGVRRRLALASAGRVFGYTGRILTAGSLAKLLSFHVLRCAVGAAADLLAHGTLWRGRETASQTSVLPLLLLALLFVVPHTADGIDYLVTHGKPIFHSPPFDTFCLLALWAWCGKIAAAHVPGGPYQAEVFRFPESTANGAGGGEAAH